MFILFISIVSGVAPAQEPLRVRRNIFGMHNLKDGGPNFDIGMEWTQQMAGTGYVFDWVTDINPWIEKAFQLNMVPCIRVQECNGGCTPGAWYASNVAWTVLNYKIAHPQYAERLVYLQLWNEPSDPRDQVSPEVYIDYLVDAHNAVYQAVASAAAAHPGLGLEGTIKTMTPGQNGPSWWNQAFTHNPDGKFAFDVWGTHPYPEATPPHYNLHDGDVFLETSKTVDSYLLDLDIVASPHGSPARSRRGFPVMITETAYGDHLGISYEGWPKTNRQMAADYNVSGFGTYWYQWPEIIAVHPFILANWSWEHFAFVHIGSGSVDTNSDGIREPNSPYPQYTAVRNLRQSYEAQGKLADARLTPYRGAVGHIAGTITRADTAAVVSRATIFTDGYEFGHASLYDGKYEVHDVPVGTYTLSVQKNGYATASQQITVTANQTTTADFSLTYTGKVSKGIYAVDSWLGHSGCSGCDMYEAFLGQTFTTPSDVAFIKYAACKPYIDGITMQFTIHDGGPGGAQIGSAMTATLESGVGAIMIGGEWPDGQEPAVQPNHTYFLRVQRADGQGVYCYASDGNPYAGGQCYVGNTAFGNRDLYAIIRGLTAQVNVAFGTIAGEVRDTSNAPIAGASITVNPGNYTASTNASGQYSIANVPIGSYSVTASKSGYSTTTTNGVQVSDGQTTTVDFQLEPGPTTGSIAGWVKDNQGAAIVGATVTLSPGGLGTTTDSGGNYALNSVAPGTYTVTASKTGFQTNQITNVQVVAGSTATANITLSPPAPFAGLCNGDFEGGAFNDPDADHRTGNCWHRFSLAGASKSNVTWLGSGAHSANYVQDFYESSWTAGIYQQVANCTIGNNYTASTWVRGSDVTFWIGIDPTGGTTADSGNIQWSSPSTPGSTWTQISKQVAGQGTTVTVFIKAQNPVAANRNGYIDDAMLTEQYVPPPQPTIQLAPTTLTASAVVGSSPADQSFTVANTGSGTLNYSIYADVGWLSLLPDVGSCTTETDTIAVQYAAASLAVGMHTGTITLSDTNATNSPQTIAVTLEITAAPGGKTSDFDGDLDVDVDDFAHLQRCLSGQDLPQTDAACDDAKLDADNDVDADDVARFLNCFTGSGPNIAFVPGCAD